MNHAHTFSALAAFAALALAAATNAGDSGGSAAPATVANAISEGALTTIALSPDAERRLAIAVATAEKRALSRVRLFAGEVVAPLGKTSGVAPVGGAGGTAGVQLAEAQVAAEGALDVARAQLDGARRNLARAQNMLRDDAGSQQEVDDARTQVALAEAALAAAQRQRALVGSASGAGARLWVRVPVHASESAEVDATREALVVGVSGREGEASLRALPVRDAPLARSTSPAIDVFYEVRDAARTLRVGQQVGVRVPLRGAADAVVVPTSALLYDAEGGSWVYERIAPNTYARRRVQVAGVVGAEAGLVGDALAGREVVTAGAAELFGTEFGAGK